MPPAQCPRVRSTGYYTFSVFAIDKAGNVGNATAPWFFAVDATLPVDDGTGGGGAGGKGTSQTTKIVIGVLVLVGVIAAIAAVMAVILARRRALRKRYGGPNDAPVSSSIPMTDMGHGGQFAPYANGNGHGAAPPGYPHVYNGNGAMHGASPLYQYGPPGAAGPPPPDPALAAALAISAAEVARAREHAASEAAEQERLRRAIAASLEDDNMRRAMEASLAASGVRGVYLHGVLPNAGCSVEARCCCGAAVG